MTNMTRRPRGTQPVRRVSFDGDLDRNVQQKKVNELLRYCEGFRNSISASGTTNIDIRLNASGKKLLGIAIIPETLSDIDDSQISLNVNNNTLLRNFGAQNACPNYVQGMIFFPTPQDLFGNDVIKIDWLNNDASTFTITVNVYYVPQV